MLSSELLKLSTTRIRIEFEERRQTFGRELQEIQNALSLQGLGRSGAAQEATREALMRELDIRASLAWKVLSRILSGQPLAIDVALNRQLKEEIATHLAAGCDDLITVHRFSSENLPGSTLPSFDDMRERALAKISSEIDIALLAIHGREQPEETQPTINIYQDDIMQAGDATIAPATPRPVAAPERFDVFISHASEDKDSIARPLYRELNAQSVTVWFDEAVLELGDSLRQKIDEGLTKCRYGVVILSPHFFRKQWPQKELDGLVARETTSGEKAVLPVWHEIDHNGILAYSPSLADRVAARSEEGVAVVAAKILAVLKK